MVESAYRVFRSIVGEAPTWEELSPEAQVRWRTVTLWFIGTIDNLAGKTYEDVTKEAVTIYASGDPHMLGYDQMPAKAKWAWQATLRHLAFMVDEGEGDPEIIEASWKEWAERKTQSDPQMESSDVQVPAS